MSVVAVLAFMAGAALLALLFVHTGFASIADALARFGIHGLSVIIAAHLAVIVLLGAAWWLVGRGSQAPAVRDFVWARAVRDAAAEALPFSQVGGYVIGARALVLSGASVARAGSSTLLDLTLEFAAKIPYVVIGLVTLAWLQPQSSTPSVIVAAVIASAALTAGVLVARSNGPNETIAKLIARWPRLSGAQQQFAGVMAEMTSRRSDLRGGATLHLVCWLLGAGETWLIFHFMHLPVSIGVALAVDSVVGGIRAVSFFVPGAIGVQEGSYVLFCGLFGISPGAALALSLARRARDLLIAIPFLLSWQWREGRALFVARFKS